MNLLAYGALLVVETDDELFLGTAEATAEGLVVRSGFVGRPVVVAFEDVLRVTPFDEYEQEELGDPVDVS